MPSVKSNKSGSTTNGNSIVRFLVKNNNNKSNIKSYVEEKLATQVNSSQQNIPPLDEENETSSDFTEINNLKNELSNEKKKNQLLVDDLKKSVAFINDFKTINLSKDIEIEKLTKQLELASLDTNSTLFSEFDNFNQDQLKGLRSVKSGFSRDSSFVLMAMRFLYPNPAVLNDISVTGKLYKKQRKEKMSEKHLNIVTSLLRERINSEEVDQISTLKRLRRVNKLIRDAIIKMRPKKIDEEKSYLPECVNEPQHVNELSDTGTATTEWRMQPQLDYAPMPYVNNAPMSYVQCMPDYTWPPNYPQFF